MSALLDPAASEMLSDDEMAQITGYKMPSRQLQWLKLNRWEFHVNRAGRPVVGRLYARMKFAGITPSQKTMPEAWSLDLSKVN